MAGANDNNTGQVLTTTCTLFPNLNDQTVMTYKTIGPSKLISDELLSIISVVVKSALYQIFSAFGMTTNFLNLVVFRKMGFRDTVNVSLFALSVSDFCSLASLFWMGICYNPIFADSEISIDSRGIQYITGGWPKFYFTRVSGLITAYVTFERCLCTTMPLKVKSIVTTKRVLVVVICLYLTVAMSIAPIYVSTHIVWKWYPNKNRTQLGLVFSANRETINSITFILNGVLCNGSFFFVVLCTVVLVTNLKKSMQWKKTFTRQKDKKGGKENKASKMVTLVAVVFISCLFPGSVFSLAMYAVPEMNAGESQQNLFFALASLIHITEAFNASINTFVYLQMSSKYMQTFRQLF
ncbi:unnamed protein product, partial [Lymnaea stagnalis]